MTVFEYDSYTKFVTDFIKLQPKKGHGESRRIAQSLGISTTMVSQVLHGSKHFSLEQAFKLCDYIGLRSSLEREYFFNLVQIERAGTHELREYFLNIKESIKNKAQRISQRIPSKKRLTERDLGIFYSKWYYSAVRLLVSIDKYRDIASITKYLNLPRTLITHVIDFLTGVSLLKEENGTLLKGPSTTHTPNDSPLVSRHHNNWRFKAMQRSHLLQDHELMFTCPMSLSKKDIVKLRKHIVNFIDSSCKIIDDSRPEKLMCFNIDYFEV